MRGRTNEKLVITGLDKYYLRAAKAGRLNVPYDENGLPLTLRVWRHLRTIMTIIDTFNLYSEENSIVMEGPIEQPF
ncbi:MAG: hypothetical protein H5T94_10150 [Pseudothermotoga sp.]|nr:hypothetical protein [Pseudothermotoga sp.]